MAVWFSGMWAPGYIQLNCSTIYLCFICYPLGHLCIIMKYSICCYSISTVVCSGFWSWMACLLITLLYIHGHGLVLTYQMSGFLLCFEGLPAHPTSLPSFTSQTADATLQTLDRPPEQLNRFILVFIHPATCQHGGRREGWLWMCCALSE